MRTCIQKAVLRAEAKVAKAERDAVKLAARNSD